jgi:hypothetical protein
MLIIILLSVVILLFEVSFREINLLADISLFFIFVNLLFWHKRYKPALICGVVCSFLIDLILQNHLGRTMFSLFGPLLILTFFDNLLRVESKLSRVIFLVVSVSSSIFVSDVLFELVFWQGELFFALIVKRIIVSVTIALLLSTVFGQILLAPETKAGKYL